MTPTFQERRPRGGATVTIAAWLVAAGITCLASVAVPLAGGHGPWPAPQAHHHHKAPRGGVLLELGDEFAHLEISLDRTAGMLTVFVLDSNAERAVRIAQPAIDVVVGRGGRAEIPLQARATANPLTGEREGDSSQFTVTDPRLAAPGQLKGTIKDVTVRGQRFATLTFTVP